MVEESRSKTVFCRSMGWGFPSFCRGFRSKVEGCSSSYTGSTRSSLNRGVRTRLFLPDEKTTVKS